jgi:hypothetical protein
MNNSREMNADDFLKQVFSEDFLQEAEIEYALSKTAGRAFHVMVESGLTLQKIEEEVKEYAAKSLYSMLAGGDSRSVTLETLARFAQICGFGLEISFVKKDGQNE